MLNQRIWRAVQFSADFFPIFLWTFVQGIAKDGAVINPNFLVSQSVEYKWV
jgi:hypothetical protein